MIDGVLNVSGSVNLLSTNTSTKGALAPITIPQGLLLPVYGYGRGCQVETKKLSLAERMDEG